MFPAHDVQYLAYGFHSVSDPYGLHLIRIRIRIRIQHFKLNADPDLGFDDQNCEIFTDEKKTPSKENIQLFKTWNFIIFFDFVGHFCPPESGSGYESTDLILSGSKPDPKHWVLNVFFYDQSLIFLGSVGAYIIHLKEGAICLLVLKMGFGRVRKDQLVRNR